MCISFCITTGCMSVKYLQLSFLIALFGTVACETILLSRYTSGKIFIKITSVEWVLQKVMKQR